VNLLTAPGLSLMGLLEADCHYSQGWHIIRDSPFRLTPMPSARSEWIGLQLTIGLWVSATFSCSGVGQGFCYGHPGGNTSYRHPGPARNCWARVPGTPEGAPISWTGLGCY